MSVLPSRTRGVLSAGLVLLLAVVGACQPQEPPGTNPQQSPAKPATVPGSEPAAAAKTPETPPVAQPAGKPSLEQARAGLAKALEADRPALPTEPKVDPSKPLPQPAEPSPDAKPEEEPEEPAPKLPDLGPPLVDHPENLVKADPIFPVWYDKVGKQVVIVGQVCRPSYLLEYFASVPEKSYESVVSVNLRAFVVHAGLVAFGIDPGQPVRWDPEYSPPRGPKINIEVRWRDAQGKVQKARAQDWIRMTDTKKPLAEDFVFTGSGFWTDDRTGRRHYQADGGDFISVLNLPSSMIDLPVRSPSAIEDRVFEVNADRIPPPDTPVTLILSAKERSPAAKPEPKPDAKPKKNEKPDERP